MAIYQTGELWFGNFTNRSSFLFDNKEKVSTNEYLLTSLIVNLGDGKIVSRTGGIYSGDSREIFDKAISKTVSSGEKEYGSSADWKSILSKRCVVYDYSFFLPYKDIEPLFGAKIKESEIEGKFDCIVLVPSNNGGDIETFFINRKTNTYVKYSAKENELSSRCYEDCLKLTPDNSFNYVSTKLNNFEVFSENIFIPVWQRGDYTYHPVEERPMLEDISDIESNADLFFDNPVNKSSARNADSFTFSSGNTVIKYEKNVFELSDYDPIFEKDISFTENYKAAKNFLSKDEYIENEYYLSAYTDDGEGNFTFYFNYKLRSLLLLPSEELKDSTGIESFIEVGTYGGQIRKYKKYACGFDEIESITKYALTDYITATDKIAAEFLQGEVMRINGIRLTLLAKKERFEPVWSVNVNDKKYEVNVGE